MTGRDPIEVDGHEGGGGVLRTALGLAVVTGEAVRIDDVRGDRPEPGLKPQHVACVDAACAVSDGAAHGDGARDGVAVGDDTVVFDPGPVGEAVTDRDSLSVDIGTAGSATLVCSTVLPAALVTDTAFRLSVTGGTDVTWSPPADYFGGVTVELLRSHGLAAALDVPRRGFYPDGGGAVRLTVGPSEPDPIALRAAVTPDRIRIAAVATDDLRDADVADRLAREAARRLRNASVKASVVACGATYVDAPATGAVIVVRAESVMADGVAMPVAGGSALGEPGVPAERVAREAVEELRKWLTNDAAVDRYLADQLVPFLSLVGGAVRIPAVTDHVESAVAVARTFGFDVRIDESPSGSAVVSADPARTLAGGR